LIIGWLYPVNSSARNEAGLSADGILFTVTPDGEKPTTGSFQDLKFSQRVGNIPRKITLPDHSVFETNDNDAVDALLNASDHGSRRAGVLHTLETRWQWVSIALVTTLMIGFATVRWGMPWASKEIAFSMPAAVTEVISNQTLQILDEAFLEESELPLADQQRIKQHFEEKLLSLQNEDFAYKLHFRNMPDIPNAFALPSGDIVITDRLIELASNQEEIDSVLLHEIGHVVHRHGLQQVLHSSFLTVAIIMITGDITSVNNLAVALPVFLLESHYSRENETEADQYAFDRMIQANMDPIHFSTIMEKISSDPDSEVTEDEDTQDSEDTNMDTVFKYLSTHPSTPERALQAERYSEKFKNENIKESD
jgi:Zn-dependent protease with chaperone function